MLSRDLTSELQAQVQQALATKTALRIVGGKSKAFYGLPSSAQTELNVSGHQGVIAYEPSELMLRVRAGTRLIDIKSLLAEHGQMLAFEPPAFTEQATIGGTVACGFSGPRRPFTGGVRDFVLGCSFLNGKAELLHMGGQVMKNVAGFDVSRLMVGALGQLGVMLDISLRVLPIPEAELTLTYEVADIMNAVQKMQSLQGQPWPISGLAFCDGQLKIRLSGAPSAIEQAAQQLGGDREPQDETFWQELREQQSAFFGGAEPLWRISIAPATPMPELDGRWLIDWGGAQRWLKNTVPAATIHEAVAALDGTALCFRGPDKTDWLRLEPGVLSLHRQLKQAFDPEQLLNPHRFTPEL